MNLQPRPRPFRSMTVNMGSRKIRTMIITLSMAVAVMLITVSIIAAQLMASHSSNSFATRMLHSVSNQSLNTIMSREIPLYASADTNMLGKPVEPRSNWTSMLFYLMTDIDIEHPVTLLNGQISAMAVSDFEPLTKDHPTPPGTDTLPPQPDKQQPPSPPKDDSPILSEGKPLIYIYHTHNRESFLPELNGQTDPNKAYDKDKNITLVGERLYKDLQAKNIGAIQTKNDYWFKGNVKNEYDLSRKTAQDVLKKNSSIQIMFDIHRDSQGRDMTTTKIDGKDAARIYFIIGGSNQNWENNAEFAKKLHAKMEQLYPGLSRGVHKKIPNPAYDTTYNQDLSPHAVLIEIGGPDNTLQEAYYTADLLANVVAAVAKDELNASKKGNSGTSQVAAPKSVNQNDSKSEPK